MCVSALEKSVWSFEARGPGVSAMGGAGGGEGEGPLLEEMVPGIVVRGAFLRPGKEMLKWLEVLAGFVSLRRDGVFGFALTALRGRLRTFMSS